jgi:hypothetical protein
MGRTSKFSFPLPGRKQRMSAKATAEASPLAEEAKLSKAERLLGATGLPINNLPQHQRLQPGSDLRKNPSSLTLTVYEPSLFDDSLDFEPPIPDIDSMPAMPDLSTLPDPTAAAQRFNSQSRTSNISQKLGIRASPERKGHPRSASNGSVPSARHFKSDTNLHQQYHLRAFPSISERSSPPRVSEKVSIDGSAPWDSIGPKHQHTSSSGSESKLEKRRPSRLDLSKLFTRGSSNSVSGPPQSLVTSLVASPSSTFSAPHSDHFFHRTHTPKLQSPVGSTKLRKAQHPRHVKQAQTPAQQPQRISDSRPKTAGETQHRPSFDHNYSLPKRTINRPPPGKTKNWFDGLLEAEDAIDIDEVDDEDVMPLPLAEDSLPAAPPVEPSIEPPAQDTTIRLVERSSPMLPSPTLVQSMDMRLRRSSWQGSFTLSMRRASATDTQLKRASYHSSIQGPELASVRSRNSVVTLEALVQAPTTSLQKSREHIQHDIESEVDDEEFFDVRDSIALSDLDAEISFGEAQAFHVRSGHFLETKRSSDAVETQSQSVQSSTAKMLSPIQTEQLAQPFDFDVESMDQTPTGLAVSRADSVTSPMASPQSMSFNGIEPRQKMMVVTEEEEALLEMMRQKRAAMASHNFAAGYKTALLSSPQSPMFMNVKRDSLGNSTSTRSRSSRPSPSDYAAYDSIHPPLSPPPTNTLPSPPDYQDAEFDMRSTRNQVRSIESAASIPMTSSNTASLIISNLEHPSHPQYTRDSADSLAPQNPFRYSPAASSSGSGLSLSLSQSSTYGSGPSPLLSPITPHAPPAGLDFVMVANGSTYGGSDHGLEEMLDRHHHSDSASKYSQQESEPLQSVAHKSQYSTNTIINLYRRSDSIADTQHDSSSKNVSPVKPRTDFEIRMAEIRSRTMAATLAATKAYSIDTIRKQHRLIVQKKKPESNSESESASLPSQAQSSHPMSPTHAHSGSGCSGHMDARCSVAEDVMEAWSSLGGMSDFDNYREYAAPA